MLEVNRRKLNIMDFCKILGINELPEALAEKVNRYDFTYEHVFPGEQCDVITLKILKLLENNTFAKTGDKELWEKGWNENLEDIKTIKDLKCLIPKYTNRDSICRFDKKYIKTENPIFESQLFDVMRHYILMEYFNDCSNIFEFGCGSGQNIVAMTELYPEKQIHGLDWTQASVDIMNHISEKYNSNIKGHLFDICSPNYNLEIPKDSGIITIGCLEQIHTDYKEFVDYLIMNRPKIVVHIEPILEFYDDTNLIDYLAIKYHKQKNYLEGYYTYLKQLELQNEIKIIKTTDSIFGNIFNNPWSIIVWEII